MDRITDFLNAHREEILAELSELVSIPSVQGAPVAGAPFGREVKRMHECAAALGKKHGFSVCLYDEYVLMEYGEGEETLGIFCHGDVVPASADEWTWGAPFALTRREGFITGRGVRDDKGAIIQALWLPEMLREMNVVPKRKLVVFIGGAEETGMQDIDAFNRCHPMPDLSITPDNAFPVSVGEKGRVVLSARSGKLRDVTDISGGIADNLMMSRAEIVLRDGVTLSGAPFAVRDGVLISTAPAVHAAHCADYHSALLPAAEYLAACPALCDSDRAQFAVAAKLLADGRGTAFGIAGSDGGFGENTCCNGSAAMRDGKLELRFDFRISGGQDADAAAERIRAAVEQVGWEVAELTARGGFMLAEDSEAVKSILAACEKVSGQTGLRPYYSGGGTYASHLDNAYSIAAVADYLPVPQADLPQGHGDEHQPDETVALAAYLEAFRHLVHVVSALTR